MESEELYKKFGFPLMSFTTDLELVTALTDMYTKQILAIFLLAVICLMQCSGIISAHEYPDLVPAANNHHHGHGRVQIKVYRGPSEGHEHFAPHGYWVKQPADDHRHHH